MTIIELNAIIEMTRKDKEQVKILTHQIEEREKLLKQYAKDNANLIQTNRYQVKLTLINGESFKLKDAKNFIDNDLLTPFITSFTSERLNYSVIG